EPGPALGGVEPVFVSRPALGGTENVSERCRHTPRRCALVGLSRDAAQTPFEREVSALLVGGRPAFLHLYSELVPLAPHTRDPPRAERHDASAERVEPGRPVTLEHAKHRECRALYRDPGHGDADERADHKGDLLRGRHAGDAVAEFDPSVVPAAAPRPGDD